MRSNVTPKIKTPIGRFSPNSRALLILVLLVFVLVACSGSTPPGPNSVSGVVEQASYLLIDWDEGLRILIWDDIPYGSHGSASSSSTSGPPFNQEGSVQSGDGRHYEYSLESSDGRQVDFTIDGIPYDLEQGTLFLIHTSGGATQIEQLDLDLSGLSPTEEGIAKFGRQIPKIAAMIAGSDLATPAPSTTGMQDPTPTAWDEDLRTASALDASPEEVTRFFSGVEDDGRKDLPPELDPVIAAVLSNDLEVRRALVHFTTAGCTNAQGLGGPPKCGPDVAEGTPVQYLPILGPGEGVTVLPEDLDQSLDFRAETLFAAYRRGNIPVRDVHYAPGEYGLFFARGEKDGTVPFVLVHVNAAGQIVRLDYLACLVDAEGNIIQQDSLNCAIESIIEREAGEILVSPGEFQPENFQIDSTPTAEVSVHPLAGLVYKADDGLWIVDQQGQSRLIIDQPDARISPDGRYAVFQPEYDPDIWLADLSTVERHNLTESSGRFHGDPQWWPGQQDLIIFGSSEELGPGYGYPTVVRTDGSDYRILDQEAGGPLALSLDGQKLAYGSFAQAGKIYHWDGTTEAFDPVDYGLAVEKIFQPAWSRDGRQLAWKVSSNPDTTGWSLGIAVFDLETKTAELFHTFTPLGGGMFPHYLTLSPNNDRLAFVTFNEPEEKARSPVLWIAQPDGQGEIRLGTAVDPVWSPDGQQLAYTLFDDTQSANLVSIYDTVMGEERQVLPAGSAVVDWLPPTAALFQHLQPVPQLDTSEIPAPTLSSLLGSLYLSFIRSGRVSLLQDGVEISLSDDNSAQDVKISADGQLIAFTRYRKINISGSVTQLRPLELWVIMYDGTDERLVIGPDDLRAIAPGDQDVSIYDFDWIPSTHTLLFNTIPNKELQKPTDDLHLVNVDAGDWKTLLSPGEGGDFLISPDSQFIAITSETQIKLLNVDHGEVHTLLTFPRIIPQGCCWYYPSPVWAADSRSLSVVIPEPDLNINSKMTIWHLPIDGSLPTITSEFAWECHCLPLEGMISPDLSWIAYPKFTQSDEDELHIAKIDGTGNFLVSGLGNGNITSINWAPESDRLAVGIRSGLNSLYLVQVDNSFAIPVSDAITEDVSWIDSSHFFYHTGNIDHPVLSIGTVGGTSEAMIEFDDDSNTITRFIVYDFTK